MALTLPFGPLYTMIASDLPGVTFLQHKLGIYAGLVSVHQQLDAAGLLPRLRGDQDSAGRRRK